MSMTLDALIIGAGAAGLFAGGALQRAGWQIRIVDKGRGLGGRMATRRIDRAVFDHGVQYVRATNPHFTAGLAPLLDTGSAVVWSDELDQTGQPGFRAPSPAYRGTRGITDLAKAWAADLPITRGERIEALRVEDGDGRWIVRAESGTTYHARRVLLTMPVPQALDLFDASALALTDDVRGRLAAIQYDPCFALLVHLDRPSTLKTPGALAFDSGPLCWIADNQVKGISTEPALTLLGSAEFSNAQFETPHETIRELLLGSEPAAEALGDAKVLSWQVQRWRYSFVRDPWTDRPYVTLPGLPGLWLAGDGFTGSVVESAALSGLAVAQAMLEGASTESPTP